MGLFFPSARPKSNPGASAVSKPSSAHTPHTSGQVTPQEFKRDVMGRLRRDGMSEHDRAVVDAAATGFLDTDASRHGMSYREKTEFIEDLGDRANRLGLDQKDIQRVNDALDRSL